MLQWAIFTEIRCTMIVPHYKSVFGKIWRHTKPLECIFAKWNLSSRSNKRIQCLMHNILSQFLLETESSICQWCSDWKLSRSGCSEFCLFEYFYSWKVINVLLDYVLPNSITVFSFVVQCCLKQLLYSTS